MKSFLFFCFLLLLSFFQKTRPIAMFLWFLFAGSFIFKTQTQKALFYWRKLSKVILALQTKWILTLVFFLLLTPLSFLYRALEERKERKRRSTGSTFKERNHTFVPSDFEYPG